MRLSFWCEVVLNASYEFRHVALLATTISFWASYNWHLQSFHWFVETSVLIIINPHDNTRTIHMTTQEPLRGTSFRMHVLIGHCSWGWFCYMFGMSFFLAVEACLLRSWPGSTRPGRSIQPLGAGNRPLGKLPSPGILPRFWSKHALVAVAVVTSFHNARAVTRW